VTSLVEVMVVNASRGCDGWLCLFSSVVSVSWMCSGVWD